MKTELEDISPIKKRLKVEVLPEIVNEAREKAFHEVQKKVELPGFRVGKVPRPLIEQKFLREIQKEAIEKIVDQTLLQALTQKNVRPISAPEIEPGLWQSGGGFSYQATFEVLPEIELKEKDYKQLTLEKEEIEVKKEEIDQEITRLQQAMTQLEPLAEETSVEEGHVVIVDYKGKADGKEFKGAAAKDFPIEIGAGALLKDFEGGLKGAKQGEEKTIPFEYPKDYFNKELAGKKALFQVKVKSIRRKIVPELNDDFAKDLGNFKNMGEVREDAKKRIGLVKEADQKNDLCNQILRELAQKTKFDLPEALVHNELNHLLNELARDLQAQGEDVKKLDANELVKKLAPSAAFRVRSFLLLNKLSEVLNVQVTEEELRLKLEGLAKAWGKPLPEVKAHYEKNRLLDPLKTRMTHEKVLEIVLNQARIKVVRGKKGEK